MQPCHARFRASCLRSALAVFNIASRLLRDSLTPRPPPRPRSTTTSPEALAPHRSGTIINHLFMACVVLATDPALGTQARAAADGNAAAGWPPDPNAETRRRALAEACRLLERAAEGSPIAASVVGRLVSVFRHHSVHGVNVGQGAQAETATGTTTAPQAVLPLPLPPHHPAMTSSETAVAPPAMAFATADGDPFSFSDGGGILAGFSAFEINGLWDDFMCATPAGDSWGPLFADLDTYCSQV